VSFWSKKKKDETEAGRAPRDDRAGAPPERAETREVALLRSLASPFPPTTDEAVAALRALRASPDEARAVDLLVHLAAERPLADPVAVATAACARRSASRASLCTPMRPPRRS